MNLVADWLDFLKKECGYSINTCYAYEKDFLLFIEFLKNHLNRKTISNNNFFKVTVIDVRGFLVQLSNMQISARSRSRAMSALRSFYKYCKVKAICNNSSVFSVKLPKMNKFLPRPIEISDAYKVGQKIDYSNVEWINLRDSLVIFLLYGSGVRISEALNIKLKDVNLAEGLCTVYGKGSRERLVPVLNEFIQLFIKYVEICPYMKNKTDSDRRLGYVFFGVKGGKLHRCYFARRIKLLSTQMGILKNVTPHVLRHSCATHLIANGMSIRMVSELLGHKSLDSTQIYTSLTTEVKNKSYINSHPHAKN